MNIQFSKEVQMTNMKKVSIHNIEEMQIKTTMRLHFTQSAWLISRKLMTNASYRLRS
jgi:hypothetical protein